MYQDYDMLLSPTLSTVPPELGHLSTTVDYETLLGRIVTWMTFTPIASVAGAPSVSLPMGFDDDAGVPVGALLSSAHGAGGSSSFGHRSIGGSQRGGGRHGGATTALVRRRSVSPLLSGAGE